MSDLISRQAAIDEILGQPPEPHYPSWYADQIKRLPSAQPERKKGRWLDKKVIDDRKDAKIQQWQQARCSCCNKWHTTPYMYYFINYDYCPNCGADMRGEQNDLSD